MSVKHSLRSRVASMALVAAVLLAAGCERSTVTGSPPASSTPSSSGASGVDWPVFDLDAARSGVNSRESALVPSTLGRLHGLWSVTLPQVADSTPVLLHNVAFPGGVYRDVLYLTTKAGTLLALDAATGAQLWKANPSGPRITNSSPAVDPAGGYVYSYGLDGKVHKYRATTGAEVRAAPWPVTVTLMPSSEKQGSALNIANGFLYVTTGGYIGDAPPYQGHVVAVDLAHGVVHVFNSLCSNLTHVLAQGECPDNQSGIWSRGGAVVDPVTGNVFVTTGNGPYTGDHGGYDWGDSVLELSGDASRLLDTYTPPNQAQLSDSDTDLGSASPALLPRIASSRTPLLAVQASKDGLLRLLNRQNLSGRGGPGHLGGELQDIATPGGCGVLTQPAVWTDARGQVWLFVTDGCATAGYQVVTTSQGVSRLRQAWSVQQGATSPVVAGGVLYAATYGRIFALNPHTGRQLWSSTDASAHGTIGGIHWESPIVVDGRLYCSDENGHLTAYGF